MTLTQEEQRAAWREKYRRQTERLTPEERRAKWREKAAARYWRNVEATTGRTDRLHRQNPHIEHATHCPQCSAPIVVDSNNRYRPRKYCGRACANQAAGRARDRQAQAPNRRNRRLRDQQTPGLGVYRRYLLLARWRRQGRTCAYCPRPASTVDHVVPLIRGGTNWEGNLVPCCRPCNSSKGDRYLIEWQRWVKP